MMQYEDDRIQFNLLALCKSPVDDLKTELCTNARTLMAIEKRLDTVMSDWQSFIDEDNTHRTLFGADESYQVTSEDFENAEEDQEVIDEISKDGSKSDRLMEIQKQYSDRQKQLKMSLLDELQEIDQDNKTAASRRCDLTPLINSWIARLAEKGGVMRQLCEEYEQ